MHQNLTGFNAARAVQIFKPRCTENVEVEMGFS